MSVSSEDVTLDTYNSNNNTVNRTIGRSLRPSASNTSLNFLAQQIRSATNSLNRAATVSNSSSSSNRRKLPWGPIHTRLLDGHEAQEDIDDGGSEGGASSIGTQNNDTYSRYGGNTNYNSLNKYTNNNDNTNNGRKRTPRRTLPSVFFDRGKDTVPVSPNGSTVRGKSSQATSSSATMEVSSSSVKHSIVRLSSNKGKGTVENDLSSCVTKDPLSKLPDHLVDIVIIHRSLQKDLRHLSHALHHIHIGFSSSSLSSSSSSSLSTPSVSTVLPATELELHLHLPCNDNVTLRWRIHNLAEWCSKICVPMWKIYFNSMQQIMYPFIAKRFSLPPDLAVHQNNTRDSLECIERKLQQILNVFFTQSSSTNDSSDQKDSFSFLEHEWNDILHQYNQLEKYFITYVTEEKETIDTLIEAHFLPKEYTSFIPRLWSYWLETPDDEDDTQNNQHPSRPSLGGPVSSNNGTEPASLSSSYLASSSSPMLASRSRQGTEPSIIEWKGTGTVNSSSSSSSNHTTLPPLAISPSSSSVQLGSNGNNSSNNHHHNSMGSSPLLQNRSRSSSFSVWFQSTLSRNSPQLTGLSVAVPTSTANPSLSSTTMINIPPSIVKKNTYQDILKLRVGWLLQYYTDQSNDSNNNNAVAPPIFHPEDKEYTLDRIGLTTNQKDLYSNEWSKEWIRDIEYTIVSVYNDTYSVPSSHRLVPIGRSNGTMEMTMDRGRNNNDHNHPTAARTVSSWWNCFRSCLP